MFVASPRERRRAQLALLGVVALTLVLVAAALLVILPDDPTQRAGLLQKANAKFSENPGNIVTLIVLAVASLLQLGYLRRARRTERLILDDTGIRYQSPLPRALQALQPGWSISWSAVGKAYLRRTRLMRGPLALELVLVPLAHGAERRLRPHQWVDPRTMDSPLVRLAAAHLPQLRADAMRDENAGFALERHPRTLAIVALLFALLAYAITDYLVATETYAGPPPLGINLAAALVVAVLAWRWLLAGAVPPAENAGLALLLGCALAAALYPGLLRVNQLTDRGGLVSHLYELRADLSLRPVEHGLPVLRFSRYADYWAHFPRGSLHEFELRRGGLGFYQVDMAPVNDAMRAWYTSPR
jgi:hypothetical protein